MKNKGGKKKFVEFKSGSLELPENIIGELNFMEGSNLRYSIVNHILFVWKEGEMERTYYPDSQDFDKWLFIALGNLVFS